MTKSEYISYIKNILGRIDQTQRYHDNVVAMAITTAHEQLFNELYRKGDLKNLDQYAQKYYYASAPTSLATAETGWAGVDWDDIGAHPINIDRKSSGVIAITNAVATQYVFKPLSRQEYLQSAITDYQYFENVLWYVVEAERLLFVDNNNLTVNSLQFVSKFNVYMIPKFYDLASTDNFNIPRGMGHALTKYTLEVMGVVPPKDLLTDNSDQ